MVTQDTLDNKPLHEPKKKKITLKQVFKMKTDKKPDKKPNKSKK